MSESEFEEPSLPSFSAFWQTVCSTKRSRYLSGALFFSLLVHGLVLWCTLPASFGNNTPPHLQAQSSPLQVRLSRIHPAKTSKLSHSAVLQTTTPLNPTQIVQKTPDPVTSDALAPDTSVSLTPMPATALFDFTFKGLDIQYYPESQLDETASPLQEFSPPSFDAPHNITLIILVYIDDLGFVDHTELVSETPAQTGFAEAVQMALENMQYDPAIRDHQYVRSVKKIEVIFDSSKLNNMEIKHENLP